MKITQDAALGGLFVAIGGIALLMALQYPFGTADRMGPGYFPVVVSTLLVLTGTGILVRGRLASSEAIVHARWLPLLIVPGAVALFGLLVEKLGLPLAVMLLTIGAATASVGFQLSWKATAGAAAFSAVCALVFVKLLGLPIPLVGSWLPALGV